MSTTIPTTAVGKIVKSNTHVDYVCQVYSANEVLTTPQPSLRKAWIRKMMTSERLWPSVESRAVGRFSDMGRRYRAESSDTPRNTRTQIAPTPNNSAGSSINCLKELRKAAPVAPSTAR